VKSPTSLISVIAGNILLEHHPIKQVHAVLTDFGISNVVEDRVLKVKAFEVRHQRGLTVAYAAPEAIFRFRTGNRHRPTAQIAKAGDVYSFSVVVYMLVVNCKRKARGVLKLTLPN
jgi:serine/threonine protein kinase